MCPLNRTPNTTKICNGPLNKHRVCTLTHGTVQVKVKGKGKAMQCNAVRVIYIPAYTHIQTYIATKPENKSNNTNMGV